MNVKKALLVLVVVFLGFWMFQDPHGFSVVAKSLGSGSWEVLTTLFTGLIQVIHRLN